MGAAPILTILRNGETIKSQAIEGEVLLGRGEGCVIRLEDRAVSRQHAAFRPVDNGVQVEKRNEFAPLVVNGVECTTAVLKEGDVISIGPYLMRLNMPRATESPSLAPTAPVAGSDAMFADPGATVSAAPTPALSVVPAPVEEVPSAEPPSEEPPPPAEELPVQTPSIAEVSASVVPAESEDAKTRMVAPAQLIAKLIFPTSSANVTEFDVVADEISIGRGKNCDIVLNDRKSSRKHAVIRREGGRFVLRDLQSANGTFVNDIKVQEQVLTGDDIVRIGDVEFQFLVISADYVEQQKDFMPVAAAEPEPDPMEFQPMAPDPGMAAPQDLLAQGLAPDGAEALAQPAAADAGIAGIPGISGGIPGIPGLGGGKKQTLLEKFRALPRQRQAIYGAVGLAVLYLLLSDEPKVAKKKVAPKAGTVASTGQTGPSTFESLTADQKKYVEAQHALAFDLYRNRDYDKALFEVRKIFALIPDYKDAREIERYSIEGKRKLEAIEEERRKKEEEARVKAEVAKLVDQTEKVMDQKQYDQAKELFGQILALDPENQRVGLWRKEIEEFEDQKRIEEQQRQVRDEVNKRAWEIYAEGLRLKKAHKCHSAIDVFAKVKAIGAEDKRPAALARKNLLACQRAIARALNPVLAEAKQAEDAGEYAKAYQLYKKATKIDPPNPKGYAGIERVRTVLHDRAKDTYTEAVLAESYSDFSKAKTKFQECLNIAPEDDIYYERAQHKLAKYFPKGEAKVE